MFGRKNDTETVQKPDMTQVYGSHYPMGYFGQIWRRGESSRYWFWKITLFKGPKPYPILGSGEGTSFAEVHNAMRETMKLWVEYGHPHIESKN